EEASREASEPPGVPEQVFPDARLSGRPDAPGLTESFALVFADPAGEPATSKTAEKERRVPRRGEPRPMPSPSKYRLPLEAPIADDRAVITGLAHLGDRKVMFLGHQKGKNLAERQACNFGCAHPEGYRKALAKMRMAEKFALPIVSLIDTPGAYPGIGAEERG